MREGLGTRLDILHLENEKNPFLIFYLSRIAIITSALSIV
jgi:hypothetical protein